MPCPRSFLFAFAFWGGVMLIPEAGRSADVDVALVLAVDISNSMDTDEQELQREGYVAAFRSPLIHQVIRSGMLGRVAVTYVEWAASTNQQIVMPWTEMEGPEDAISFAEQLARAPLRRAPRTSISGAIDFSVRLLRERPGEAMRRVIDISGDGANNQGRRVTDARDDAVAKGITINGLPLLLKPRTASAFDVENLDEHYRDCVIGGIGSFMMPVRDRAQLAEAIKTKILREIAGMDQPSFNRNRSKEVKLIHFNSLAQLSASIRTRVALEPEARLIPVQVDRRTNCSAAGNLDWDGMPY